MKQQTWQQWARAVTRDPHSPSKITKDALGALTGTDTRVLDGIVACWFVYAYTGENRALAAVRLLLPLMQDSTRWIARELIPFVMDWSDRDRIWPLVSDDERLTAVGRSYGAELREEDDEKKRNVVKLEVVK